MLKRVDVITLFPQMFEALQSGVTGKALDNGLLTLGLINPRDFTHDRHRTVDDRPYGGGPGMLMKVEPLRDAILSARAMQPQVLKNETESTGRTPRQHTLYLSPQGKPLNQNMVQHLYENYDQLILVAGRYEGIDERLIQHYVDDECSIGDYVLSGGELAAMVVLDALIRLVPGALGHKDSAAEDSFSSGLLDCPHYTRPEIFEGIKVPEILLGGNHSAIKRWRLKQSLGRTWLRRPDILAKMALDEEQQSLLNEFIDDHKQDEQNETHKKIVQADNK